MQRKPNGSNDPLIIAALDAGRLCVDPSTGRVTGPDGNARDTCLQDGYRLVNINRRQVRAHRVVWIACEGPIPAGMEINHRNRVRDDNRICNLELVLPIGNQDHARGRTDYLRVALDDEGAIDPRRLTALLSGLKSQQAGRRSRVLPGPNADGVAMRARTRPGRA